MVQKALKYSFTGRWWIEFGLVRLIVCLQESQSHGSGEVSSPKTRTASSIPGKVSLKTLHLQVVFSLSLSDDCSCRSSEGLIVYPSQRHALLVRISCTNVIEYHMKLCFPFALSTC